MLSSAPIHPGSALCTKTASAIRRNEKLRTVRSPVLTYLLAPSSSLAPTLWATPTVKPMPMEVHKPPTSQVVVDTTPMAADALAPKLPTMEASIYSIIIVEIWAIMAGKLRANTSLIFSSSFKLTPFLTSAKRSLLFVFCVIGNYILRRFLSSSNSSALGEVGSQRIC